MVPLVYNRRQMQVSIFEMALAIMASRTPTVQDPCCVLDPISQQSVISL
jgi:hypothetical protein